MEAFILEVLVVFMLKERGGVKGNVCLSQPHLWQGRFFGLSIFSESPSKTQEKSEKRPVREKLTAEEAGGGLLPAHTFLSTMPIITATEIFTTLDAMFNTEREEDELEFTYTPPVYNSAMTRLVFTWLEDFNNTNKYWLGQVIAEDDTKTYEFQFWETKEEPDHMNTLKSCEIIEYGY
jgi:hypothetical protein